MTDASPPTLYVRGRAAIGDALPPYLMAEIGTNHNRDLETARRLVHAIAEQGFDCAKFQIYEPEEIVSASVRASDYGLEEQYGDISAREVFEKYLKTPKEWFPELRDLCHGLGLDCAATIHGENGLDWANAMGFDLIKIASMDHTNTPFLSSLVNRVKAPILISFGMAVLEDIDRAVDILKRHALGVGLFHCVAVYPPKPSELRLNNIPFLKDRYKLPVGFSDHTTDTIAAVTAVALGACCFEKHITLDHTQPGPDHHFALEPDAMGKCAGNIRDIALGLREAGFAGASEREMVNRATYVKSIVARRDLSAGHVIDAQDLYLARPGSGIQPCDMEKIIGQKLTRGVAAEALLSWSDLETQPE